MTEDMTTKVVSDEYGTSYRYPNLVEEARCRGPPDVEFIEDFGQLFTNMPWQFTLIEAQWHRLLTSTYSVYMAHAEATEEDQTLCFREASTSCKYLPPDKQNKKTSNVQHIVLPSGSGEPGDVATTLRITNGGDTDQYDRTNGPYRHVTPREWYLAKQIPKDVTWCVSFNFMLHMEEPEDTSLHSQVEISGKLVSSPHEWMDSMQIQILHGGEPKHLCVAFRVVDPDVIEIDTMRYVKPILFSIMKSELESEEMEGDVLRSVYRVDMVRKAETNGYLTLPWRYLDIPAEE